MFPLVLLFALLASLFTQGAAGIGDGVEVVENAAQLMQRLDTNHDGVLLLDEFFRRNQTFARSVTDTFQRLDANKDNKLTIEELTASLKTATK